MKILVCPLNWGLGHATRCVPIIRKFLSEGHEVVLAADGFPLEFLCQQFPDLRFVELPSYHIRYSSGKTQVFAMLWNLRPIISGIKREHKWLKKELKTEHFDLVFSDNRFGLWSKKTHCIFMTHQLMIKMPLTLKLLEPLAWFIHRSIIKRYTECWIPDKEGKGNFSGDLSHKYPLPPNGKFIGTISRFKNYVTDKVDETYDVVAVLSGVEPQRSIFEHQLIQRFQHSYKKMLIICGQPSSKSRTYHIGDVTLVSHLPDEELVPILKGAKKIISRSGYSTIMDLEALGCLEKTEFIPTPGQTEQEYLAKYLPKRRVE